MNVRYDHVSVFVVRAAPSGFEFLQLRRREGDYLGGTWQTVRGSAKPGETSVQAALRELKEETSLTPGELFSLGIIESFYLAQMDTLFHSPSFLAYVEHNAMITLDAEHDAFRWITRVDAEDQFMWPSEKPLLAAITQILDNHAVRPHLHLPI